MKRRTQEWFGRSADQHTNRSISSLPTLVQTGPNNNSVTERKDSRDGQSQVHIVGKTVIGGTEVVA